MSFNKDFTYTGDVQTWIVPFTGVYQLEVWGAQGGSCGGYIGGYGGYSSGNVALKARQILYIYVGGEGKSNIGWNLSANVSYGGWNGGGGASSTGSNTAGTQASGGGGGATDMRLGGTELSRRIIVAGGGGGIGLWAIGTNTAYANGGCGGGILGDSKPWASGATQTSGYALGQGANANVHVDIGGGGGGYYGGFASAYGTSDSYICGGGGGSGYVGNLEDSTTQDGNITKHTGNGFARVSLMYDEYIFILKNGNKYYMPVSKYFNENAKSFKPVTFNDVINEINNDISNTFLKNIITPFTIGKNIYNPLDYLDISKCELCIIPCYSKINQNLAKIQINYTPTSKALSKTEIKVKELWNSINEALNNPYLDVTATDKSNIEYKIDYYNMKQSVSNTCDKLDTVILKDHFYNISFKFKTSGIVLKSYKIYTMDKVNYTKIKETYLDIERNLEYIWVTFRNPHSKVLVNILNKHSFKYIEKTLDTF